MVTSMVIIFIAGYMLIALERTLNINKTAIALILGITLWVTYIFFAGAGHMAYIAGQQLPEQLGQASEILFYLLGALIIVEIIDAHQGFSGITRQIKTRSKRKLLWLVVSITFLMSSVLDNMTSAIVMMTMLAKILDDQQERWLFGSLVIIAANAGGAWTPIGDVTTIMLWINDNITSGGIMKGLFLSSLLATVVPTGLLSFSLKGQVQEPQHAPAATSGDISRKQSNIILFAGVSCLLLVPVFKSITHLPPFAGILFLLGFIWIYIDMMYNHLPSVPQNRQLRVPSILTKIDFSTILFFLGILLAVAALESSGILRQLAEFLNNKFHNIYALAISIGLLSSVIDNVPLVAATIGMYPVADPAATAYMANFVQDGDFWQLIAYSAGTGGSLLIIGSVAGVVVMGLEKINFIWYLKHISWAALIGFLAGIGIYWWLH